MMQQNEWKKALGHKSEVENWIWPHFEARVSLTFDPRIEKLLIEVFELHAYSIMQFLTTKSDEGPGFHASKRYSDSVEQLM